MRDDLVDITLVLDKSGSMANLVNDTIGGVNNFLTEQKAQPGEALFTLLQFDTTYSFTHKAVPIKHVPQLDGRSYQPGGMTALRDAMGRAIIETGQRLKNTPEAERPGRVLFVVITDGEENSSHEITGSALKAMVQEQTNVYKWEFLYLGANVDAFAQAGHLGISLDAAASYGSNSAGIAATYKIASSKVSLARTATASHDPGVAMSYTSADRIELEKTIVKTENK